MTQRIDKQIDTRDRRVAGIYAIQHATSKSVYVGSSVNVPRRWREHLRQLKNRTHHAKKLQKLWDLDAPEAFKCFLLEVCRPDDLLDREQYYLDSVPVESTLNSTRDASCSMRDPVVAEKSAAKKRGGKQPWVVESNHRRKGEKRDYLQYYGDKDHRALLSRKGKERWATLTPSERKELTDTMHAEHASAEFRAAMSANKKAEWARLSVDERNSRMVIFRSKKPPDSKRRITPEFVAAMKASWTDPVRRAKRIAAMKIGSARRWGKNGVGRCRATT